MEKFSKIIIMLIVIDIGLKSAVVEGGRGLLISKEKDDQPRKFAGWPPIFPGLPPIFPGFPNWNFPGQPNPGQPDNPGFPGIPGLPFFGFPPLIPGAGNLTSPLFPFLPYFSSNPPQYCIPFFICIPLPDLFPPALGQPPQAAPDLPPPDQGPLAPTVQPSPTNPSPLQPPPAQTPPLPSPMA
ncbi:hypothetical protein AgCh_016398 [Apium graveolens]